MAISAETQEIIERSARQQGCTVEQWLADAYEALSRYHCVDGRRAIATEGGTTSLADSADALLREAVAAGAGKGTVLYQMKYAIDTILEWGPKLRERGDSAAGMVAYIGKQRQARAAVERWSYVVGEVWRNAVKRPRPTVWPELVPDDDV